MALPKNTAAVVSLLFSLALVPSQLGAQGSSGAEVSASEASTGEPTGWHVVRPGDTLESVTAFYLGSSERWRENRKLNPEVADPNRIYPGQRLRVLLAGELPERTARLKSTSRKVEDQLQPNPWDAAWNDDLLRPRDGVRTFDLSSAELDFADGTSLILTERSLVFLWNEPTTPKPVERKLIEIVEGQADLAVEAAGSGAEEIEIVFGAARAKPRPDAEGELETRARKADEGGAQLMVYGGSSELEAAGQSLEVAEGMGSTVEPGASPSPPEKLLDPPVAESPAAGSRLAPGELDFRWRALEGARDYTVEVCRDPRCAELVDKAQGLEATVWRSADLPRGTYYWRVTATSPSRLDGYPSEAARLDLGEVAPPTPSEPVTGELFFTGPQAVCGERLTLGPGALPAFEPDLSIAGWRPVLDGEEFATPEAWAEALTPGEHEAAVVALGPGGTEWRLEPVSFVYDAEPPAIVLGRSGLGEIDRYSGLSKPARHTEDAVAKGEPPPVEWRVAGGEWLPMGNRHWRYFADKNWFMVYRERGIFRRIREGRMIDFERPEIELRSAGRGLRLGGAAFDSASTLRLEAEDEICRIETLGFRLGGTLDGGWVLWVEAVDSVGNRTRLEPGLEN